MMKNTMKRNMMKGTAILLVIATMILCMAGCGSKKATAVVTFEDVKDCEVFLTANRANVGKQLNVMTVTVELDGEYPFVVNTDNGQYNFTLTYDNGIFTAKADPGLNYSIVAEN